MVPDRSPRSCWGIFLALGLAFASLGHAQEQTQPAEQPAANEQRPAETIPLPVPVEIIEDDASALARKQSEAEARQREIEDLAAQKGMNVAAQAMNEANQKMAEAAMWQTRLASIGTAALLATLLLMWNANRVTRHVGQQQTRAYVYPSYIGIILRDEMKTKDLLPEDWATVVVKLRNYGQSPAKRARASMSREVWAYPPPPDDRRKPVPIPKFADDCVDVPPGNVSDNRMDFTLAENTREAIEDERMALYVFGRVEYYDTFGEQHFTNFLYYSTGTAFITGNFRTHSFGNEAD